MINTTNFFGIHVIESDEQALKSYINDVIKNKSKLSVFGVSVGTFVFLKRDRLYINYLHSMDINLFDGRLFYYLAKMNGLHVNCSLSIPEFVNYLLELARNTCLKVYLLGATESVNDNAIVNLTSKGIMASGHHGYFVFQNSSEISSILEHIDNFEPSILLIGMTTPLKEEFYRLYKSKLPNCIIILCGGMIDILAGKTKQTPAFLKKIGLAACYRTLQEPRRLYKGLFKNMIILVELIWIILKNRILYRRKS